MGRGKFGTVYEGVARGVVNQAVAIKLLKYGTRSERAKNADAEARRYVTLPSHPHIVKLMDVVLLRRQSQPLAIGMVFERFDTDVRQFLEMSPLNVSGMRHVLRCVLAALAYMHELGVVHAGLKTANMLLRGKGVFSRRLAQTARESDGGDPRRRG